MAHNRCACTGQLAQCTIGEEPPTQCGSNEGNQLSGEQMDRNRQIQLINSLKFLTTALGSL